MKSLNKFSFLVFGLLLVLFSCSSEKRTYMPGRHIEWNISKHHPPKQKELVNKDKVKLPLLENNEITPNLTYKTEAIESLSTPTSSDENMISSVNLPIYALTKTTKQEETIDVENKVTPQIEKNKILKIKHTKAAGSGISKKGLLLMILGLALIGLGYIFFLSLGVFGLILFWICGVGGAIYFIIGFFMMLFK